MATAKCPCSPKQGDVFQCDGCGFAVGVVANCDCDPGSPDCPCLCCCGNPMTCIPNSAPLQTVKGVTALPSGTLINLINFLIQQGPALAAFIAQIISLFKKPAKFKP